MIRQSFWHSRTLRQPAVVCNEFAEKRATFMSIHELDGKADLGNHGPLSRREILSGIAAFGAAAVMPKFCSAGQTGSAAAVRPFRIDTHHHFSVPKLIAESTAKGITQTGLQDWTPQKSIDQMDKGGVATSIISITDPGAWFADNPPP